MTNSFKYTPRYRTLKFPEMVGPRRPRVKAAKNRLLGNLLRKHLGEVNENGRRNIFGGG
jgi:hypothetical protein